MVSIKEVRTEEWRKVNECFDTGNILAAEAPLETLELMLHGEEKAETEFKDFKKRLREQGIKEYQETEEKIAKKQMNMVKAETERDSIRMKGVIRDIKATRAEIWRLARAYDLFVTGE